MYNVILLVVDSLSYERLIDHPLKDELFMYKCYQKYPKFDKLFSQAPYTEAAVMGLTCGQRVLDYGGYFKRLTNTPITIYEAFKENGYRTFNNTVQPHMYASSLLRGLTDPIYNNCAEIKSLYEYRVSHYIGLNNKGLLGENELNEFSNLIEDYLSFLVEYYEDFINDDQKVSLIKPNVIGFDFRKIQNQIKEQLDIFNKDKKKYLYSLIELKEEHPLYKIEFCYQNDKVRNDEFRKTFLELTTPLKKRIEKLYFRKNLLSNKDKGHRLIKSFGRFITLKEPLVTFLKDVRARQHCFFAPENKERFSIKYDEFKSAPSLLSHLNNFDNWLKGVSDPYFAFIHFDDIHMGSSFLSYDFTDVNLLKEEINDANHYLDNLPKRKAGNLCFDLGIYYVDRKIEDFINKLDKENKLNDTVVIVTGDHGYSNYYYPYRGYPGNTFFKDHYHIPFIFAHIPNGLKIDVKEDILASRHNSYSIPNTLLSLAGLKENKKFYGSSLFNDKNEYNLFEYLGGGCPDIHNKDLEYCYLDDEISVSIKCRLDKNISKENIYEIYDLKKDFMQNINLVNKKHKALDNKIDKIIDLVNKRHLEIRKQN